MKFVVEKNIAFIVNFVVQSFDTAKESYRQLSRYLFIDASESLLKLVCKMEKWQVSCFQRFS